MELLNEESLRNLIRLAIDAQKYAYIPYSNYPVGAALLTKSGKIYTGVNVENASFSVTNCAERTAIFKAVSEGEREFEAIVVATRNGGSPCGACRQVMAEFALDMVVVTVDSSGTITARNTVSELLPGAFVPASLSQG